MWFWYVPDCGHQHFSEDGNITATCPDGYLLATARAESDALRAALVLLVDATGLLLSASETPLHDGWQMAPDWTAADFACQVARAALAPSPAEPAAPEREP